MTDRSGEEKNLHQSDEGQVFQQSGSRHVNVAEAEEQFNVLSRQLTIRSEGKSSKDTDSTTAAVGDLEKGAPEHFDLREYLTSSNDANQKAGIKHKVSYCDTSWSFGSFTLCCRMSVSFGKIYRSKLREGLTAR